MATLCVFLLIAVPLDPVLSLAFYLPVNSIKCLQERIGKDVLVSGEYEVSQQHETTRTTLKIVDSLWETLYIKENATKGKLSFVTPNYEQIEVCFSSISPMGSGRVPDQLVILNLKHGVEAQNNREIEKLEKLTPLEAKLTHLEHLSQSIADDFTYLRKRGKEMRQTNSLGFSQKSKLVPQICKFSSAVSYPYAVFLHWPRGRFPF
ncbi:transmembrane emp24 domain-containing protein 10-like isoform X2 [Cyclopterus lumpus]|uniref:transmembrane emp24 domain-containing protein 10-like isoform X2 n=1 Tax=Cyclopterus lumpus TaxID=8103 RepID=UPI00148634E0|nr:transmembrane emp24 domain-containing protein 10-like isoform X2 [Cyclopterus lumpus]